MRAHTKSENQGWRHEHAGWHGTAIYIPSHCTALHSTADDTARCKHTIMIMMVCSRQVGDYMILSDTNFLCHVPMVLSSRVCGENIRVLWIVMDFSYHIVEQYRILAQVQNS
jgi:hypothetical protein